MTTRLRTVPWAAAVMSAVGVLTTIQVGVLAPASAASAAPSSVPHRSVAASSSVGALAVTVDFGSDILRAGASVIVTVRVTDGSSPVADADVTFSASEPGGGSVSAAIVPTDATGVALVPVRFPTPGSWIATARATTGTDTTESAPTPATVSPADVVVSFAADHTAITIDQPLLTTATVIVNGVAQSGVEVSIIDESLPATPIATGLTDSTGVATASPLLSLGTHTLHAGIPAAAAYPSTQSPPLTVTVTRASLTIRTSTSSPLVSEAREDWIATVLSAATAKAVVGLPVTVSVRAVGVTQWRIVAQGTTTATGTIRFAMQLWKSSELSVQTRMVALYPAQSTTRLVRIRPMLAPVVIPVGAPQPRIRYPDAPAPVAPGAHPTITAVPSAVRRTMIGRSWTTGCTPFSRLAYVSVNYWGLDGFRYRGHLVVATRFATATARTFTALYVIKYRIRSIFLPDRYGHMQHGPGANDYASMAADNTYGFNCRYIVGKEAQHVWSPHAYGIAIDINPWENPYASRRGILPNSWWYPRTRRCAVVLTSKSPSVKIFAHYGFRWGGSYKDYQHFQI